MTLCFLHHFTRPPPPPPSIHFTQQPSSSHRFYSGIWRSESVKSPEMIHMDGCSGNEKMEGKKLMRRKRWAKSGSGWKDEDSLFFFSLHQLFPSSSSSHLSIRFILAPLPWTPNSAFFISSSGDFAPSTSWSACSLVCKELKTSTSRLLLMCRSSLFLSFPLFSSSHTLQPSLLLLILCFFPSL